MKFRYAVLLAALAIAPVCAKRIRVSDECRVIDSTLSVDSAGFDRGGLCSSGNRPLSFRRTSKGGGLTMTTTRTTRANADVGARRRRRTTRAAEGALPGAMTMTRTTHAHRD